MKPVANLYSVSLPRTAETPVWQRVAAIVPTIPNYVWLGMILLTGLLLATSTMVRMRSQVQAMQGQQVATQSRLAQAQSENVLLKETTHQLKTDVRAAAQAAQVQLHRVRANEIVIATK